MFKPPGAFPRTRTLAARWNALFRRSRFLAFDFGASHIACAEFSAIGSGRLRLHRFACEQIDPDPAADADAGDIARSLKVIAERRGIRGAMTVAMPGHLALTKFMTTALVSPEKREKIIRFEASQSIPYRLEEVEWDYAEMGNGGGDIEVLLAAIKSDAMQSVLNEAKSARLSIEHAVPSAVALHRAFRFSYPDTADCVLLVNVGARTTQILLIRGNRFAVRTLPLGGNLVTQTIAAELQVAFANAEAIKRGLNAVAAETAPLDSLQRAALDKATRAFCDRLLMEITRSSASLQKHPGDAPVRLFLAGAGSLLAGLRPFLAEALKFPVIRYSTLNGLEMPPDVMPSGGAIPPEVIGLASEYFSPGLPTVNLLPTAEKRRLAFRRSKPSTLVAAVVLSGAVLLPLWHQERIIRTNRAELTAIERELEPHRRIEASVTRERARWARLQSRSEHLDQVVRSRTAWVNFFDEIQHRLLEVGDVWLDELTVVPSAAEARPTGSTKADTPIQVQLSGRLIDRENPVSRVSEASYSRVTKLLAGLTHCEGIAAVGAERFDNTSPGILRFEVTLTLRSTGPF